MFDRHEVDQLAVLVDGPAGQGADLVEGAGVEQKVDPLADGEPAGIAHALHALGAAHPPGQLLAPAQLGDLRLPRHPDQCGACAAAPAKTAPQAQSAQMGAATTRSSSR